MEQSTLRLRFIGYFKTASKGWGCSVVEGLPRMPEALARRILGRPSTKNGKGELMNKPVVLTSVV